MSKRRCIRRIVQLIPDDDTTARKRADQYGRVGVQITTFAFRRNHNKAYSLPDEPSVHVLGLLPKRRYFARIPALISAVRTLADHAEELRSADMIIARNLDLLWVMIVARAIAQSRSPLAYEIHDVARAVQGKGLRARILRTLESLALRWVSMMILTSQAFVDQYFKHYHNFTIPYVIVENKIYLESFFSRAPGRKESWTSKSRAKPDFDPQHIRLGWIGGIRCSASAQILRDVARRLGDRLEVHVHGRANFCTEAELREFFAGTPNVKYHGTFNYPDDFIEIYRCDLNWCFDFSDSGQNTHWLLPNRIYEGGYFGVPALAERGTATGNYIETLGAGWTFERSALADQITSFLSRMDAEIYLPVKRRCVDIMDDWRDTGQSINAVLRQAERLED